MSTLQGNAHGLVARPRALRVALIAVLLTAGVFALPPSSFGQATVEDISITSPVGADAVDDTHFGAGVVGTLTGTDTLSGRTVETETGFHFAGSLTLVYRIDLPDGSYIFGSQTERQTFSGTERHEVFGGTLLDKGTLYDANGVVIGDTMFMHGSGGTSLGAPAFEFTGARSPRRASPCSPEPAHGRGAAAAFRPSRQPRSVASR